MTEDARTLPVTVTLTPPLLASAASASVRERTEAGVAELLRDLGVPRRPDVDLREGGSGRPAPPISVSVGGRSCNFPDTTIPEALAYLSGTAQVAMDAADALENPERANGLGPDELAGLVASVCRAAISAQPGILVNVAEDAALHAALSLGMSIAARDQVADEPAVKGGDPAERLVAALAARTIDIYIDPVYLRVLVAEDPGGELFRFTRESLFTELGLSLPAFHLRPDPSLRPAGFAFQINSVRTLPRIGLPTGTILVNDTPEHLASLNVEARATVHPRTSSPAALAARENLEALEAQGFTTWTAFGYMMLCLAQAVCRSAHALMTRDMAASMTQQLGQAFPVLEEAARTYAPPDVLAPVLRDLLFDGISVRNLYRIMELLLRHETVQALARFPDPIAFVRTGLADVIAHKFAVETDETLLAYLVDPEIEDAIASYWDGSEPAGGEEPLPERLSAAVRAELSGLRTSSHIPAILSRDELRRPLRALLRHEFPRIPILAYGDLPPSYNVQPVARISWA